jgi:Macrocin-O-methyltransferase (TylF)
MFRSTLSTDGHSRARSSAQAASAGDPAKSVTTEESLRPWILDRATPREISALRPRPGEEALRAAYLELLKLCLCDLAGARTLSVGRTGDTRRTDSPVFSHELSEEELPLRAVGGDWPFSGLTMVGLSRLDDLQACVEAVIADGVEGDMIEAGAWRGGASILARATLDSLGADDRTVWVADSFQGLPQPDPEAFPEDHELDLSRVDFLAVPPEEVLGYFARFGCEQGVELVEGYFDQTLPTLRDRRWAVIRLDGDSYEATWVGLESLYPGLSAGGYLVVDDYVLIEECRRAVDEYRSQNGITEPIEQVDWNGIRWRRESEPATTAAGRAEQRVPRTERGRGPARPGKSPARAHIPTRRELDLERELGDLRERLRKAEGELERLRSSAE